MFERVAVTGIGVVSPIGTGVEKFRKGLYEGVSGIAPITHFNPSAFHSRIAGEVKDFIPAQFFNPRKCAFLSRAAQFGLAASHMALKDSGLAIGDGFDWMVSVGCGMGGFEMHEKETLRLAREAPANLDALAAPAGTCATVSAAISIEFGIHGETATLSTACSSGLNGVAYAYRQVRSGQAKFAIAGGTEAPIAPTIVAVLANGKALSRQNEHPEAASRPFDRRRDGYVIAEGAAFFILERMDHALKRGARIYAEIAGCGITSDAFSLLRLYDGGEHLAGAMKRAMYEARLNPEEIDYIGAHGSSSVAADIRETLAIKEALGHHARRTSISAVKSMIGMPLAAGGALQAAATVLNMHYGVIHPTINLEEPDPACDLDYVPNTYREREIGAALVNSTGMGGTNVCLAFRTAKSLTWASHERSNDLSPGRIPAAFVAASGTPVL